MCDSASVVVQVTNTPWGARVRFVFDPDGETVHKAMHVSPLMDMKSTWTLKGEITEETVQLSVKVEHPEMGSFFDVILAMQKAKGLQARNERCGFLKLIKFGY